MRMIDTYTDVLSLFYGKRFDLSVWREYAHSISPSLATLAEADAAVYEMATQVIPVIERATDNLTKLEETHASFVKATTHLSRRVVDVLGADLDVDLILYLGLCNGAGWATSLDGRKVVLLGLEKIIELDWCDAEKMTSLIYHELGHLWHEALGNLHHTSEVLLEQSVWQLYQEGVAMYCEQLLCGDLTGFCRHDAAWLSWCKEHKDALFAAYVRRIDQEESTQDFFGDWCSYQGHSDIGYYLGCELVKSLLPTHSLNEIAKLGVDVLLQALRDCAKPIRSSATDEGVRLLIVD